MSKRLRLLFCLLTLTFPLAATEFSPWLPMKYDVNVRGALLGQAYSSLDAVCGNTHKPACDLFAFFSVDGAPCEDTDVEIEFVASDTRYKNFGFDAFKLTGRIQLMNDIPGDDPISLTTGLTISAVTKPALHDLSSFYHGRIQAEVHVAYGKEFECKQFWASRTWAVVGLGLADAGSAWMRGNLIWEKNWWDLHRVKVFANSLWGFGKSRLNLSRHFKGYGSINHQSVDVGLGYAYVMPHRIELAADYSYRIYARNCPRGVSLFKVSYLYPLGL